MTMHKKPEDATESLQERAIAKKLEKTEELLNKILHYIAKDYPNWFRTYELTRTTLTQLHFENETGGYPLTEIYVINVGGGLWIGINGNEDFAVVAGQEIKGDINILQYRVTSGKAYLLCQCRID